MKIEELKYKLFEEEGGGAFFELKNKLIKTYGKKNREDVIDILMQYVREGQVLHLRPNLVSNLVDLVHSEESKYGTFFEWTITLPELTYWGMDGVLKTIGKAGYQKLVDLIEGETSKLELRAKAIKSLSEFSKQDFDKNLPQDPGGWKITDLNVDAIIEWQRKGYPDGIGYTQPVVHPSLLNPITKLEKIVSKLEKRLAKMRGVEQDLSNPTNWLTIANENDIADIQQKWNLPEIYLMFLKSFSPLNVFIEKKEFNHGLSLYGASDLIEAQNGYAYNSILKTKLEGWPSNFLVIADDGADPYCIEIGPTADKDVPVYTCEHANGPWDFELYADSFLDFIKGLT